MPSGVGPRAVGTERVNENERQWKTREDQAWIFICVLCVAVVHEGLPLFFCVCLFYY